MTKGDDMGCLGNMTAAEKLMALAADWEDRSCGLYVHLREGSEGRWGVNWFSHGSVSEILREIADRAREEQADLKMFAERVHGMLWGDGWHPLDETADRLDEELSELDRVRCRLPEEHEEIADGGCCDGEVHPVDDEDYEACRWVRDHGGLDAVRGRLGERKRLVDRCRAYEDALDMMADSLGVERSSDKIVQARRVRKAVKNLDARLVPDGMEWPRYEDGEPVLLGGTVDAPLGEIEVEALEFRLTSFGTVNVDIKDAPSGDWSACKHVRTGERVKRPAPKVLDADGEEIGIGDKLYDTETGCARIVRAINANGTVEFEGCENSGWFTKFLTHRAPVLAADGRPLRDGDTVWKVKNGDGPYHIQEIRDGVSVCVEETSCEFMPKEFTHHRPDSWERLEEDCAMFASDYAEKRCLEKDGSGWGVPMRRDLVRRAKKLAGVE